MARTLPLALGAVAVALVVQSAALAARQDAPPASDSVDLLQGSPRPARPARPHRAPPFHGLLAAGEAEVVQRLGPPDIARAEGKGAMWTYRLPDCALFVFFRKKAGEPLRFVGASAGPRVRGRTPPPVTECLNEALERHAAQPAPRAR